MIVINPDYDPLSHDTYSTGYLTINGLEVHVILTTWDLWILEFPSLPGFTHEDLKNSGNLMGLMSENLAETVGRYRDLMVVLDIAPSYVNILDKIEAEYDRQEVEEA